MRRLALKLFILCLLLVSVFGAAFVTSSGHFQGLSLTPPKFRFHGFWRLRSGDRSRSQVLALSRSDLHLKRSGSAGAKTGRGWRKSGSSTHTEQSVQPVVMMGTRWSEGNDSGLESHQLVGGSGAWERVGGPCAASLGFAYGPAFGPSSDRTWTMEAAMVASLRQIMSEAGADGWGEAGESPNRLSAKGKVGWNVMKGLDTVTGSVQRIPPSTCSQDKNLCRLLAEHMFKLVSMQLEREGRKYTVEGIITEVQNEGGTFSGAAHAFVTLLKSDGTLEYHNARDVTEIRVCTVGGSAEAAAKAHLCVHRRKNRLVPPSSLLSDVNLSVLRAMSASFGRQVLVQNLRHIILGFSGCRALWTEFLSTEESRMGKDEMAMWRSEATWMVKVMSEHESKSESPVKSTRWVPVSWVLPMSDYDLHVYSAYRHNTLPSSEYDLQRHDEYLLGVYTRRQSSDVAAAEALGLVGGAYDTVVGGTTRVVDGDEENSVGGESMLVGRERSVSRGLFDGDPLWRKYQASYTTEDLALVG